MNTGKFIVIEGTDGSGKATQVALLKDHFDKNNIDHEMTDFPQYDNFSGAFVAKYLRGEYGGVNEVGPYTASVFYAVDRYDKSFDIRKWLEQGKTVLSNRYISANMGHQTAKIEHNHDRDRYLDWLCAFEYDLMKIPRPDVTILLYMPPEVGQLLVDSKADRAYTHGKKRDIHEADLDHLKKASEAYLYCAQKYGWSVVSCVELGKLLTPDEIHQRVLAVLRPIGIS